MKTPLKVFLIVALCSGLLPGLISAQQPGASDQIHPRLFFTAEDIPALQEQARTTHQHIWLPIEEYVREQVGTLPPSQAPVNGSEDDYRNFGSEIITFAFACLITESPDYCQLSRDYLVTYARWNQWGNSNQRDLGHAHMLMGNAMAYDWMFDYLTPEDRQAVHDSLVIWTQRMYQASVVGEYVPAWVNWWPKSYMQNHYYINHAALGLSAMVLMGETETASCSVGSARNVNVRSGPGTNFNVIEVLAGGSERVVIDSTMGNDGYQWWQIGDNAYVRSDVVIESAGCAFMDVDAQLWLDRAVERITVGRDVLESIADGSWHEGMLYQNYMLTMTLPFMVSLRQVTGIDLLPYEYLENYTYWRLYNYVPGTDLPLMPFGDIEAKWGNSYASHGTLRFIANEFGDGRAEWLARELADATIRTSYIWTAPWYVFEFLYYNPSVDPVPPEGLPLARTFPDLEGAIWRTGWAEDDLLFGFKTGPYGGRFAHDAFVNDEYPFEQPCVLTGCQLLIGHDHNDANSFYLYGSGAWLAPENLGFQFEQAYFHNTLLIDGQDQYRPPDNLQGQYPEYFRGTDAALVDTVNTPSFDYLAADATRRYQQITGDLERYVRHVLFVRPGYFVIVDELVAGAPHQYEWVSFFGDSVSLEGEWLRGNAGNDQVLSVQVAAPETFDAVFGQSNYPYARVRPSTWNANTRLAHVLYPTDSAGWDARPLVTVLQDTDEALALQVDHQDGSGRKDVIQFTFQEVFGNFVTPAFGTNARVAVTSWGPDGTLQRVFTRGASYLFDIQADLMVLDDFGAEGTVEAAFNGTELAVSGEVAGPFSLYAPQTERVTVNGVEVPFAREGDYIAVE